MLKTSPHIRFIQMLTVFDIWLLMSSSAFAGMMGHGMMGHHKGGGSSGMETMLVAGILAKLLSQSSPKSEKDSGMAHPMYVPMPMPMIYHHMPTPMMHSYGGMGGGGMGGGGGGGYGMGGGW